MAEKIAPALEGEAHELFGFAQGQLAHADGVRLEPVQGIVKVGSHHETRLSCVAVTRPGRECGGSVT